MNEKNLLKIAVGLLVVILTHNLYLNYELLEVKENARKARQYSSYAEDYAEDAKKYAKEASEYASDAVDYARDAADNAQDAADNAYANNCSFCPN